MHNFNIWGKISHLSDRCHFVTAVDSCQQLSKNATAVDSFFFTNMLLLSVAHVLYVIFDGHSKFEKKIQNFHFWGPWGPFFENVGDFFFYM